MTIALLVLLDAVLHVSPEIEEHPLELVHRRDMSLAMSSAEGKAETTFVFRNATNAHRISTWGG
jgi:hypothetical protein